MDDATAIVNELNRYAELVDAGRFGDVGRLMEHCTFSYGDEGDPGPSGAEAITQSYEATVIVYAGGTPRTRHLTCNPQITVNGDTATARSVYVVFQLAGSDGLQAIITGRYHDRLRRIDGRWRFTHRRFFVDLCGDLSGHLRAGLPADASTHEHDAGAGAGG